MNKISFRTSRLLIALLTFITLTSTACLKNKDDDNYTYPNYVYYIAHVDSLGQLSSYDFPALSRTNLTLDRLKDGRILMVHDSLHVYNPISGVLTDITPIGSYSYLSSPAIDLSLDGKWLYFGGWGKIRRMNLGSYAYETLVDSTSMNFVRPRISKDGRYLCYLRSTDSSGYYSHSGGYPSVLDMFNHNIFSLSSGVASTDRGIKNAWVDHLQEAVYYNSSDNINKYLMRMNLDGTQRSVVPPYQVWSQQSFDGRFILGSVENYVSTTLYYRDNLSMVWNVVSGISRNYALARGANFLFYSIGNKVYRLNLETGERKTLIPGVINGKPYPGSALLAPGWDGKDLYLLTNYQVQTDKTSSHPLELQ
ncbi:MAG: hypothetical protein PHO32_03215 [Candidatus Cloacimonetes bacterium]|nr:hypothetical protein [Candidatus Cloacimonadota bacterium]